MAISPDTRHFLVGKPAFLGSGLIESTDLAGHDHSKGVDRRRRDGQCVRSTLSGAHIRPIGAVRLPHKGKDRLLLNDRIAIGRLHDGTRLDRAWTHVAADQRERFIWAASEGVLAGCLLWSILPGVIARSLPDNWNMPEKIEARVLREPSMWEGGARLLRVVSPQTWNAILRHLEAAFRGRTDGSTRLHVRKPNPSCFSGGTHR